MCENWITGSQQSESGTVQLIWDGLKLNETMLSENVHQWMLYLGPELYETLKEEMGNQLEFINQLADEMSEKRTVRIFEIFFYMIFLEFIIIQVITMQVVIKTPNGKGRSYALSIALVLDGKALCTVLGLYECFKHGTTYRCPWCEVTEDEIANFDRPSWAFRDINKMKEAGVKITTSGYAKTTQEKKRSEPEFAGVKVNISFL